MANVVEETKRLEALERRIEALEDEAAGQWLRGSEGARNVWVVVT